MSETKKVMVGVANEKGNLAEADALTAAEKRVLALVSRSMTNREIASSLGISPATVKRHLENILRKLRVRNRVEAAIYGLSMTECHVSCHTDCPLAAWRRSRENGRNG